MLFIVLVVKTDSIHHVCRLISAIPFASFRFPPQWLRFRKTRPKLASAVVVAVQAKENNAAETHAVAANAAPLMVLG